MRVKNKSMFWLFSGLCFALLLSFLSSSNTFALNGWNSFQTFDLSTSNLSGQAATINQSWFNSYTYGSNATSGSYSRLYNPVLYVSGNAMSVNQGQKFRIYLYGQAKHIQTAPDSGVFATNSFETDVLVRYSGNFVCTDDEISLLVDPSGVFYASSASNGFSFVHKLDCIATADNLQLHNLKLGGNLLKYQVYNDIQRMFSFDLQGKIVAYDDPDYSELVRIENAISSLGTKIDTTNSRLNTANSNLTNINNNIISSLSELRSLNSSIGSTNTKLDTANNLQTQANTDANNRYEDEKDTISDNANGGIDSVNDIDTSINVPDFFRFLLGDLTVQTCHNIPTLASWVHSSSSVYCAWFPSSVRSALSAFVNVFSVFLICSFVWSWLKKGGL